VSGFRAPGRVNLIGDHTDYNDGFVLPLAIGRECAVHAEPRGDGRVRLSSQQPGMADVELAADGSDHPAAVSPEWGRYAAGVLRVLAERGRAPVGIDAVLASTVPPGAGLSSSAALEVSLALALCAAAGLELDRLELARACQQAELVATAVPCGIMDQLASIAGRRDHALLLDCRSLEIDYVPLPPELEVLVVHSGVARALAGSAYAERRAACEAVAARLGVAALRDATPEQVADEPRARHVVSENARVLAAAEALRAGELETLGHLLSESHASLRDDFEVSTPELDVLVEQLERAGALGARLTGAGFGGCVVAAVRSGTAAEIAATASAAYRDATGIEPNAFVCRAADGAGPL
jgi:galactokinase